MEAKQILEIRGEEPRALVVQMKKIDKKEKHQYKKINKAFKQAFSENKRMKRQMKIESILEEFKGLTSIANVRTKK